MAKHRGRRSRSHLTAAVVIGRVDGELCAAASTNAVHLSAAGDHWCFHAPMARNPWSEPDQEGRFTIKISPQDVMVPKFIGARYVPDLPGSVTAYDTEA